MSNASSYKDSLPRLEELNHPNLRLQADLSTRERFPVLSKRALPETQKLEVDADGVELHPSQFRKTTPVFPSENPYALFATLTFSLLFSSGVIECNISCFFRLSSTKNGGRWSRSARKFDSSKPGNIFLRTIPSMFQTSSLFR